jgi:hypothetical protein
MNFDSLVAVLAVAAAVPLILASVFADLAPAWPD